MTSKPASTKPPIAKPTCKIHPTAVVADKAQITGSQVVEIGENVIIHPHAKIRAENGNVFIGKGSMVAEKAILGLGSEGHGGGDVVLGEGVSIETGAVIEARRIGDYSTVEVNAKIGKDAVVGRWCKVTPMCEVREFEVLEDFTVVFGEGSQGRRVDRACRDRKEVRDAKLKGRSMEMEVLRSLIPDGSIKWAG